LKLDTGIKSSQKDDTPENGVADLINDSQPNPGTQPPPAQCTGPSGSARQLRNFGLAALGLALCFAIPLWDLVRYSRTSEFHSYILLIPFISAYLVWLKKGTFPIRSEPARMAAPVFLTAGMVVLMAYWLFLRSRWKLMEDDYLAVMMISFLLLFFGICGRLLGREMLRATAFPLGMLIFMVPIPTFFMPAINSFLQHGSAAAAQGFFSLSFMPFMRNGLVFTLPNISLEVAQECSGIQSSMVLLITGLVAGYLFLRSPWNRAWLALFMIPLGLLRNGFRVFTLGELCVHLGPQMIDSPIHHRGGPIFFALSLVPLFILLVVLLRFERRKRNAQSKSKETATPNLQN
jgi:exosortase C (VPDSG-CTERM-specific)